MLQKRGKALVVWATYGSWITIFSSWWFYLFLSFIKVTAICFLLLVYQNCCFSQDDGLKGQSSNLFLSYVVKKVMLSAKGLVLIVSIQVSIKRSFFFEQKQNLITYIAKFLFHIRVLILVVINCNCFNESWAIFLRSDFSYACRNGHRPQAGEREREPQAGSRGNYHMKVKFSEKYVIVAKKLYLRGFGTWIAFFATKMRAMNYALSPLNYFLCSSYVELLESFMSYTPSDHVDRKNLAQAIAKFKDLDTLFRQVRSRHNNFPPKLSTVLVEGAQWSNAIFLRCRSFSLTFQAIQKCFHQFVRSVIILRTIWEENQRFLWANPWIRNANA